eukprot:TRINITY_DN4725_c0_g2_i1.p2 TRINITY_DN4725_c0_g2~~TRINITY_DN4725_c0_g2_i1.p2  ORF type:complete len:128 (-),score=51.64 TRINITY_DN4725_c0_g2_i1:56-439(-)
MPPQNTAKALSVELARERCRAAADRTLMAWIRTALALISFGFGLGSFYTYIESNGAEVDPFRSALVFGSSFILLGTVSLFLAMLQYRMTLKRLKEENFEYREPLPLVVIVGSLLLLIGVFGFVMLFV